MASFDEIKESTEKLSGTWEWLAAVVAGKNWVSKVALLLATTLVLGNPPAVSSALALLGTSYVLPADYYRIWLGVLAALFILGMLAAMRR